MPSKNGFGNTRKKSPAMKYGAGKNPITMKSPLLGVKVKPKETSVDKKKVGPTTSPTTGSDATAAQLAKQNLKQRYMRSQLKL